MSPPQLSQVRTTSSTYGRWGSSSLTPDSASSSASEPITFRQPWAQRQTGSGGPQQRPRDSAQSTLPSSQLPNLPCLTCSGYQVTVSLASSSRSLIWLVAMYHDGLA